MKDLFSNRWAIILASLGMAIGTGNIWRFPRMAAKYGGGTFIVVWVIFLFSWSIPLLLMEYALGKKSRRSPIGAFVSVLGRRAGWMGGFVTLCTLFIMAYYSVMTGWCLRYAAGSIFQATFVMEQSALFWSRFTESFSPAAFHLAAILISVAVVSRGISRGVEVINRIFIPSLFVLLILLSVRAVTLPGAWKGVAFLGHIDTAQLFNHRLWLEALSQSAWSTGAGWGLILVYAVYLREKEDITLNTFITGLGNNSASLLAALAIIPSIFSVLPAHEVEKVLNEGNVGLTFIYLPAVFREMPLGSAAMTLFFVSLSLAAISSLIAMFQLGVTTLIDLGLSRRSALISTALFGFTAGLPSSLSLTYFDNQDWVWGLGLILSGGLFIVLLMIRGSGFIHHLVQDHPGNDLHIPKAVWKVWSVILPLQWVLLISWWLWLSVSVYDREGWWNPLRPFSLSTCLLQWGVVAVLLILLNRMITGRLTDD